MRGFLTTSSAVLLVIAITVAALAATWRSPTYHSAGVSFTADFPVGTRSAAVVRGDARVVAWAARRGHEEYVAVVESPAALHLAPLQHRRLLARLARRLGGDLVSGWFGYAPLQDSCGPPLHHRWLAGHRATERFVGPVQPLGGPAAGCLGTLVVRLGGAQLSATALGPPASVRDFVHSLALR